MGMKKRCFTGWIAVLSVFLLPVVAFAGGFAANEQGAKASGMANAFAAQADDPTAVYFNPAGIVQLDGTQVTVGVSPVIPGATFESNTNDAAFRKTSVGQKTNLDDDPVFLPNAYMTQKINDRVSFGFATFTNFGLETNWPDDWAGRFIVGGTKAELITLSVNPVLAFKPWDRVSLAFGPVMQYVDVDLRKKQLLGFVAPDTTIEADAKFTGDDTAWGWNAALLVWLTEDIKVGASYRSEVSHTIHGQLEFNPNIGADSGFTANFKTPANAYMGLAWTHGPLTLEFDFQWTDWSSYNQLVAKFNSGAPDLVVEEDWHDAWAYRFGAQFAVNEYLDVRAGIAYDESPIPAKSVSPRIPGSDRWIYALGFGGHYEGFTADLAYQYVDAESVKLGSVGGDEGATGPPGQLEGKFKDVDAHIIAFNLSYRF
jgi:long-chain fatty acid transport protein